jgi:hypothetical protein
MSPKHVPSEIADREASVGVVTQLRVVVAADANDVMRDQLELLIEHAQSGVCGFEQCQRYLRVRSLLLTELFPETASAVVTKASSWPSGH